MLMNCNTPWVASSEIPAPAKGAVLAALRACHEANRKRNRVIHDTCATRPGNVMVTVRSERGSHEVTVTARTLAEVRQVAAYLSSSSGTSAFSACSSGTLSVILARRL